jgi:mono/diheme cytochrome c family protein
VLAGNLPALMPRDRESHRGRISMRGMLRKFGVLKVGLRVRLSSAQPGRRQLLLLLVAAALAVGLAATFKRTRAGRKSPVPTPQRTDSQPQPVLTYEYNRDIRPILAENCFSCHGPDSASRKADLRLDRRDDAVAGGVIVSGKPDESTLIARVCASDESEVMPPPRTKKTLTSQQKDALKTWIAEGAQYQPHWSFIPPQRPNVPSFADAESAAWVRSPIDAFVLQRLKERGLAPAPEADRRTLARRLSLDLTGLPPSPEEVEAFVNDKAADYYERYVDKLLASPHWGEHRGRYWLDYARYGDSNGIFTDAYREIWSYRDWVLSAFNRNVPFDQFTIEQLAGDLLPGSTIDQKVATGFLRCNCTTNEGGVFEEEQAVLATRDRTETVSQVWLGLTTGCAVCHDHKYDPLSQREFYSLSAFFNNLDVPAVDRDRRDAYPTIELPRSEDRDWFSAIRLELPKVRLRLNARKAETQREFDAWVKSHRNLESYRRSKEKGLVFRAPLDEGSGTTFHFLAGSAKNSVPLPTDSVWTSFHPFLPRRFVLTGRSCVEVGDVGDFEMSQAFSFSAWVRVPSSGAGGAIAARMEEGTFYQGWGVWLDQGRVSLKLIHSQLGDRLHTTAKEPLPRGKWTHVTVVYDGSGKAAGVKIYYDGIAAAVSEDADLLHSSIRTNATFKIGPDVFGRASGIALKDLRLYTRILTPLDAKLLADTAQARDSFTRPAAALSAEETSELFDWWLSDQDPGGIDARFECLRNEEFAILNRGTVAHVVIERPTPPGAFILDRGEYNRHRDWVPAQSPRVLPPFSAGQPLNRLGFARWLFRPDHPLTARVTVNRFWQEVFGNGLVRTSGDLGVAGELPSHPELLDWLALSFRDSGWDVKKLFKLIVTSATYRQAAVMTSEKLEKDHDNRLLSRGPRFRMDAEMIRDYALASSGLLVRRIGGPSVKPYQPDGVWEARTVDGSSTRHYRRDSGDKLYRRSVYSFWKRAAPPLAMEILNAPTRETCTIRRDRSNTPLQALTTLNDVQFVEAARVLAEQVMGGSPDDGARLDRLARRVLGRPLEPEESAIATGTLSQLRRHYHAMPSEAQRIIAVGESRPGSAVDPCELAAWAVLANQFLNLDEALNK